jgi:hypothetical protein
MQAFSVYYFLISSWVRRLNKPFLYIALLRQTYHDDTAFFAARGNQITAGSNTAVGGNLNEQLDFDTLDHDITGCQTSAFYGQFARIRRCGTQVGVETHATGRNDGTVCVDF